MSESCHVSKKVELSVAFDGVRFFPDSTSYEHMNALYTAN